MDVIATENLTKHYGRFAALRGLSLNVPAGRLFGFLGPNGAGKTTAIRLLLGLLRATAGHARVLGHDVWRDGPALRADVGYLPGDVRFYDWLTGRQTLAFFDAARGGRSRAEALRLSARLELPLDKRVRDYSRGMKQKLGLIVAMLHRPRLLILDEPTTALDPLVRAALFAELRAYVAQGGTVLFSSHTLAEVEELCDEVAILRGGELVEHERVDVLRRRAVRHVEIVLRARALPTASDHGPPRESVVAGGLPPEVTAAGGPPAGLTLAPCGDGRLRGAWRGPVGPLLEWLARLPVADVTIAPPDLEDLFRAYYAAPPAEARP